MAHISELLLLKSLDCHLSVFGPGSPRKFKTQREVQNYTETCIVHCEWKAVTVITYISQKPQQLLLEWCSIQHLDCNSSNIAFSLWLIFLCKVCFSTSSHVCGIGLHHGYHRVFSAFGVNFCIIISKWFLYYFIGILCFILTLPRLLCLILLSLKSFGQLYPVCRTWFA